VNRKVIFDTKDQKKTCHNNQSKKNPLSFSSKAFPMTSSSDALDDKL
jgi:hypothetical protein